MRLTQVSLLAQTPTAMRATLVHRRHRSRSSPGPSVFLLQPVTQSFQGRISRRRFGRDTSASLSGEVHHVQQAIKIPAIKSDGPLARIGFDPSIKSEGLGHVDGEALQFEKLVPGDEDRELQILRPRFQVAYHLSEPRRRGFIAMSSCLAGKLLQCASYLPRPWAFNFFEHRDRNVSQLPTCSPRPREKHNRFLVGDSRQGLHYEA